jgi:hypothetical protein
MKGHQLFFQTKTDSILFRSHNRTGIIFFQILNKNSGILKLRPFVGWPKISTAPGKKHPRLCSQSRACLRQQLRDLIITFMQQYFGLRFQIFRTQVKECVSL